MRLFLAVNLPVALKKSLADLQNEIKSSFPMEFQDKVAKWVAPANLHLTLLFLGEAGEEKASQLIEIIQRMLPEQAPLTLKARGIYYGPNGKLPPQLIWLKMEKNQQLEKMVDGLRNLCIKNGIGRGLREKDFSGHITLARVKEWVWKRLEPAERPEIEKELDLKFEARSIELMESRLRRNGPAYIILQSFPFARPN